MKLILTFTPVVILFIAFFIYRLSGRKELLKMDLVQFIYAFVLTPALIIWIKTAVFFNLSNELSVIMDAEDRFLLDTVLVTILLYIFAFVVIHSLTKTFAIKKDKDPLFDVFEHSEYFHHWLSHIVIYSSILLMVVFTGIFNLTTPFINFSKKTDLYTGILIGIALGALYFKAMSNFHTHEEAKFDRVIKLQIYFYTFLVMIIYILFRPIFSQYYIFYWGNVAFFVFGTLSLQFLPTNRLKTQLKKAKRRGQKTR